MMGSIFPRSFLGPDLDVAIFTVLDAATPQENRRSGLATLPERENVPHEY